MFKYVVRQRRWREPNMRQPWCCIMDTGLAVWHHRRADVWKMDTPLYGHLPDTQQTTAGGRASLRGLAGRANPSHKRGLSPYLPQLPTSSSIFFTSSEHFPDYGSPPLDPPHEISSHVSPLKVVRKFEQSKQVGVGLMRLGRRMFSAF